MVVGSIAIVATMFFGDNQARIMEKQQPMKMAAAEAIYNTQSGASFSLLTIGDLSGTPVFQIRLPHMLSVLADNSWDGSVQGINQIQAAETAKYGPGNYEPDPVGHLLVLPDHGRLRHPHVRHDGHRALAHAPAPIGAIVPGSLRLSVFAVVLPFLANTAGWIFTEMGRQPWIVFGLLKTSQAVSHVGTGYVVVTLVGFTAIYSLLAVIDFGLMAKFATALAATTVRRARPPRA
jgi:cytochrome d ubiquinol oxidase subunit I